MFTTFWHPTWPFSQRKLASRRTPCSEIQKVSLLEFGVVCIYFSLKMHLKGETNTTKPMKCICLQFGLKIKGRFIYLSWTTETEDISSRISWQFMLPVTLCNIFMQDEILVALMNTYFSWGQMTYVILQVGTGEVFVVCFCLFVCFFFGGGVAHALSWVELNWLFNVTINDISVIYVTAHRCAGGLKKKLDLRSGSQRHRHFVGFFNVPVLAPTRDQPFYTVIPTHRPI